MPYPNRGNVMKNDFIKSQLLVRNACINFLGMSIPLVAAFFSVPLIIDGLGTDRFGILTLVWLTIGYFGLFDMGLGRAMTKLLAEKIGADKNQDIPALIWTTLSLLFFFGLVGGAVMIALSYWLVYDILNIPRALQSETLSAFLLLSVSIPFVVSAAGLTGALQALQKFDLLNAVQIPFGLLTFVAPLMVLLFSKSLFPQVMLLVFIRVTSWLAFLLLCLYVLPSIREKFTFSRNHLKSLVRFSSWMTITNIIGPLMVYFDRFLIGAALPIVAVAYYATPYELVTKLLIIPGAITGVLFPAFAASFESDRRRTAFLFERGIKYVFLVLFPVVLLIVILGYEMLDIWLGSEFAQNSTRVMQWLAVGVFINCIAQVSFNLIQGIGRPDITAKLHLAELPVYLLIVWWMLKYYGIEGVAVAWLVRVAIDTVALFWVVRSLLTDSAEIILRISGALIAAIIILLLAMQIGSLMNKILFLSIVSIIFPMASWFLILDQEEKAFIQNPKGEIN